jgi:hypothetical protein
MPACITPTHHRHQWRLLAAAATMVAWWHAPECHRSEKEKKTKKEQNCHFRLNENNKSVKIIKIKEMTRFKEVNGSQL